MCSKLKSSEPSRKSRSPGIFTAELYNHVFEYENEHFHLLPSILSPHIIAMSHSCMKHRLTPLTFLPCIRHKLQLPIYPNRTPYTCGHHEHDIYGDHTFCCERGSKKRAHNIIAVDFAGALSPVLAQAGYLYPNTPMAVEPLFHLCSNSTARSFDISFSSDPTACHHCPYTASHWDRHQHHRAPAFPQDLPTSSEVLTKMILMGHPVSSCHVPVVRSCFIFFRTILSS